MSHEKPVAFEVSQLSKKSEPSSSETNSIGMEYFIFKESVRKKMLIVICESVACSDSLCDLVFLPVIHPYLVFDLQGLCG